MKKSNTYTVKFRRKREGKTNYHRRLNLLKSTHPRVVVRKSTNCISLQLTEFDTKGDKVKFSANSVELKSIGWNYNSGNLSTSYLTGLLFGNRMIKNKIHKGILDIGVYPSIPGSKIYAALKGVIDAGVDITSSSEILPNEDRISGKHIADYASKLKQEDNEKYKKQFSSYLKNNLDPEKIVEQFKATKEKIGNM